jgi:hypothetical protein
MEQRIDHIIESLLAICDDAPDPLPTDKPAVLEIQRRLDEYKALKECEGEQCGFRFRA